MLPSSLIETASRYQLTGEQIGQVLETRAAMSSLVSVLEQVSDPRRAEGRRFVLSGLLAVLVLAALAGCRSMRAAWVWARDLETTVLLGLGFARWLPARSTVLDVIGKVDMDGVNEALLAWMNDRLARQVVDGERVHVAVDGKALRGARHRGTDRAPMQLAVFAPDPSIVLATVEVPAVQGKGGEIAAAITALDQIPSIAGWVVTGDALHTVKDTARYLRARGAHYVVPVKANRAVLFAEVTDIPWGQVTVASRRRESGHGRTEERVVRVVEITPPATGSAGNLSLPGARQAIRVTSTRRLRDRLPSRRHLYYVTSLGPEDATGPEIADLIRARWGIENRLHWLRDVVFDEDRHTTRRENTTRMAVLLRSIAISLIHLAGLPVTDTTTACYRRPERLYALVR